MHRRAFRVKLLAQREPTLRSIIMPSREIIPTHSAYLELKEERSGMQEGYRFLDEKRLILASEILSMLDRYETAQRRFQMAQQDALKGVRAALGRHGFEELSIYPTAKAAACAPARPARLVLGVRVEEPPPLDLDPDRPAPASSEQTTDQGPVNRSPEAERCRACCARLIPIVAHLAVLTGNLERLRAEYVRTARRARALEDVLLPEIDETLNLVDAALEEQEREEVVRVHRAGSG
jgi:V/A-type H+-transporting ATPase subunit D